MFGHDKVTSGAASDIEQATRLAKMMVTRWGFSDLLGQVAYGENNEDVFLGMSMQRHQNVSEATAQTIDKEVRRLVDEGYTEAKRILTEKYDDLEALARGLLEYETLSGDEIVDLLDGKTPNRRERARAVQPARLGHPHHQAPPPRRVPAAPSSLSPRPETHDRPEDARASGRFSFVTVILLRSVRPGQGSRRARSARSPSTQPA